MFGAGGGDTLGAAVEFDTLEHILHQYGPLGIQEPDGFYGFPAFCITDDSQQSIAVGEGLIAAVGEGLTIEGIRREVWHRLKDWHASQRDPKQRRAPGATSLQSLAGNTAGSLAHPLNHSSSCGGMMRAHPIGILYAGQPDAAYEVGVETAVLTHGGELGVHAAGMFAAIVSELCDGKSLTEAYATSEALTKRFGPSFLVDLTQRAMTATPQPFITPCIGLGLGWDGHEALALGLYAARCHEDSYLTGVRLSANHDGDTDSTASITGALLGARLGLAAIPREWTQRLERRADLARIANTLAAIEPMLDRQPA
jgi:ADP-ribosylglycohydrolase